MVLISLKIWTNTDVEDIMEDKYPDIGFNDDDFDEKLSECEELVSDEAHDLARNIIQTIRNEYKVDLYDYDYEVDINY